jgi:G patch domain/KOW motif-containing protein
LLYNSPPLCATTTSPQAPSFLPTESEKIDDDKRFEISETIGGETAQGSNTTYGLTRMGPKDDDAKAQYENKKKEQDKNKNESFIGKSLAEKELEAFKEDVEDLPEEASMEAYESMPIEDFGAAMLRGMGWKEGEGVGRNAKSGRADPVEFVPRMGRLGLGADTMDVPGATLKKNNDKKILKPGESREEKTEILVRDPNASRAPGMRNVKSIDEKLVKKEELGVKEGKRMYVAKGKHEGLTGRVLKIQKADGKAQFELDSSGEVITLRCSELDEMANAPAPQGDKKRKSSEDAGNKKSKKPREEEESEGDDDDDDDDAPWLYPSIRVRIISKSFSGGIYYLKKGTIVDIPTPKECTVQIDGDNGRASSLISNVRQSYLETCVPKKPGGRVVILTGKLRGRRGKLVQKNKSNDTARIQLSDDFTVHDDIDLDEIAEYVGEMDEDE